MKDGRISSGRRDRGIAGKDAGGPLTFVFVIVVSDDVAVVESMGWWLCACRQGRVMREGKRERECVRDCKRVAGLGFDYVGHMEERRKGEVVAGFALSLLW